MPTESQVALIALAGVALTALASSLVALWQSSLQRQRQHLDMMHAFGIRVFEERMKVYPQLYSQLSAFVKLLEFDTVTRASVRNILVGLESWDSEHSILFSSASGRYSYALRHRLFGLAQMTDDELHDLLGDKDRRFSAHEQLLRLIQALELAMKNELGAYAFEGPARTRSAPPPTSYRTAE